MGTILIKITGFIQILPLLHAFMCVCPHTCMHVYVILSPI